MTKVESLPASAGTWVAFVFVFAVVASGQPDSHSTGRDFVVKHESNPLRRIPKHLPTGFAHRICQLPVKSRQWSGLAQRKLHIRRVVSS